MTRFLRLLAAAVALVAVGCVADDGAGSAAARIESRVVFEGLASPTQMTLLPDGRLAVAQLAGGEDAGDGQVVVIDLDRSSAAPQGTAVPQEKVVLIAGLDKPTGVAVFGGSLWVMERDRLSRFSLSELMAAETAAKPTVAEDGVVMFEDLPNNGRSNGTLTVIGNELWFNTSGRLRDGAAIADSGKLWATDTSGNRRLVADGLKNGYAHVDSMSSGNGGVWVTEIADGSFDDLPAADALVLIEGDAPVDVGWPRCVSDPVPDGQPGPLRAVAEFGGTPSVCENLTQPVAVFERGATPTSVAVVPWNPDQIAVALWNSGEVVTLSTSEQQSGSERLTTLFAGGRRPQHLLAVGDVLLLSDHESGELIELDGSTS